MAIHTLDPDAGGEALRKPAHAREGPRPGRRPRRPGGAGRGPATGPTRWVRPPW
jgi:hypothetical protein